MAIPNFLILFLALVLACKRVLVISVFDRFMECV